MDEPVKTIELGSWPIDLTYEGVECGLMIPNDRYFTITGRARSCGKHLHNWETPDQLLEAIRSHVREAHPTITLIEPSSDV